MPERVVQEHEGDGVSWDQILTHWDLLEADLHEKYGIDVDEPGLMQARSWRWFRTRVAGLLATKSRLSRALAPPDQNGAGDQEWH
ncbi:hypothetical protein OWR29_25580 [Actinoplanes sp. Pm04-4]|uniref:Uncharacterized protein n=1 Tax=Paractinoplanes pyxinae TaxID=2997416 RepID=A0ABT4B4F2_9ACTN|nr:hypothetical protein [Actinoplanes pyxinae]